MGKRKTYSKEFKLKAVNMVIEQGQSPVSVAKSLGVGPENLRRWVREHKEHKEQAFPGNGIQALTAEQQRIKDLEAENHQLKLSRKF